jgi:hypothetical protein
MFASTKNYITHLFCKVVLIFFISAISLPILCQQKTTTIVPIDNPDGKINRQFFEHLTTKFYRDTSISDVKIFLSEDCFYQNNDNELFYDWLDSTQFPVQVIKSTSNCLTDFENQNIFKINDSTLRLGLNINTINPNGLSFIPIEFFILLRNEINFNRTKIVYLFSRVKSDEILNLHNLLNLFVGKQLFFISINAKDFSYSQAANINYGEIFLPVFKKDIPVYYLLTKFEDSLVVTQREVLSNNNESISKIKISDSNIVNLIPISQTVDNSIINVFSYYDSATTTNKLIVEDNKIITIKDNGEIKATDFNCKEKFATQIIGNISTNCAYYKDLLLVPTIQGDLYCLNSNNGELLQVVGIGEDITSDIAITNIKDKRFSGISVIAGTLQGNVYCYDAFSFEIIWKKNISSFAVVSKPLFYKDKIFVLDQRSSLYCLSSETGALIWKLENKNKTESKYFPQQLPLTDGKSNYYITMENTLLSIDMVSGKKNWSVNLVDNFNGIFISQGNQNLYNINSKGLLSIINMNSGKESSKIDLNKKNIFSFCIAENNNCILIGLSDGSVQLIDPNTNKEILSATNIPVSSINFISENEFVVLDKNGLINFYKIKQ